MTTQKLTVRTIEAIQPGDRDVTVYDTDVRGFGIKVTPKGRRSYFYYYRTADHIQRRPSIGTYPSIRPEQARNIARDWEGAVRRGEDPSAARRIQRAQRGTGTVIELFADYKAAKAKNRSIREVARLFQKDVLPAIGKKRAESITKADINRILDKVSARSVAVAGNLRRNLSAFFNWCLPRLPDGSINPVSAAIKISAPTPRERVLTDSELTTLWRGVGELGDPWRSCIRLLILTGARRSEVLEAEWSEFDLDERLWIIPADRAKNGKAHLLPLSDEAIQVLQSIEATGCITHGKFAGAKWNEFDLAARTQIIPRRRSSDGRRHVVALTDDDVAELKVQERSGRIFPTSDQNVNRAMQAIRESLPGSEHWTLHDLRRTVATGLQRLGVRLEVTEAILNHVSGSRGGIAGVYQRYDWFDEKREALAAWASHVLANADDQLM